MTTARKPTTDRDQRFACYLELLSGLATNEDTRWKFADWWRLLLQMHPRDARVVVLHCLHRLTFEDCAERLCVSRNMARLHWIRALRGSRLRPAAQRAYAAMVG